MSSSTRARAGNGLGREWRHDHLARPSRTTPQFVSRLRLERILERAGSAVRHLACREGLLFMQAEIPSLAERLQGSFSKCPAASGRREAQPSTGLAVAWHSQKNHTSPKAALLLLPSHPPIFLCRSHPFNIGTILDSVLSASFLADSIWRTLYASLPRLPAWYLGDSRSTAASTRTLVRYETEKPSSPPSNTKLDNCAMPSRPSKLNCCRFEQGLPQAAPM